MTRGLTGRERTKGGLGGRPSRSQAAGADQVFIVCEKKNAAIPAISTSHRMSGMAVASAGCGHAHQ